MKIKKYLCYLIFALSLFTFVGCGKVELHISTNDHPLVTLVGESVQLSCNSREVDGTPEWESEDESVATITESGLVTFINPGTVRICCECNGYLDFIRFEVTEVGRIIDVSDYVITSKIQTLNLYVGDVILFNCEDNETGEYATGSWTCSNPDIASIDSEGILSALSIGSCTVTFSLGEDSYSITINVINKELTELSVSGKQYVKVGEEITLSHTLHSPLYDDRVYWISNDKDIATVSEDGVVSGLRGGLVNITCVLYDNNSVTCDYLVYVYGDEERQTVIINELYQITGSADFTELSETLETIYANSYNSIIGVENYQTISGTLVISGVGTGFIYKRVEETVGFTYYIITNNHVVNKAEKVCIYNQPTEEHIEAKILATDADYDLAVCSFTSTLDIAPLKLIDSNTSKAGQFVIAIGHSTGFDYYNTATFGIISYPNRKVDGEAATFVQHDAAINNGNSGGPLLDMNGEVIGVNSMKFANNQIDNMSFSINIDCILEFLNENDLR